jgi:hypothetical protein
LKELPDLLGELAGEVSQFHGSSLRR